jgi:RND family efflux transporter MFP subunit
MKLAFRIFAPLLIVAGAAWLARHFIVTDPEPKTFAAHPQVAKVEATRLQPTEFQVLLETQGSVRPRTTSTLVPEVSGRIIKVSPNFREGGFFGAGETLLEIEPVNYETALVIARSAVAEAERALQEERARGEQAIENWRRLGKRGEPSELAARKPQLAEAEARLLAAKAEVEQANRDLERTRIKAPFAGRVVEQMVDVGQFVSSNTQLGRAFATDVMEVRLPLTNRQLSFIDLPAGSIDGEVGEEEGPEVLITGRIGQNSEQWTGHVVRVDSSIDESSRQLFVVAEVKDPYHLREGEVSPLLKIGMFVDALVEGDLLKNVFVLPREAVRIGGEVVLIDEENRIRRQKVDPIWTENEKVVVPVEGAGIEPGDVLCLTPLTYPVDGAPVIPTIDGITPEIEQPGGPGGMPITRDGKGKGKGKGRSKGESAGAQPGGKELKSGTNGAEAPAKS